MRRSSDAPEMRRESLHTVLRRAHFRVVLIALVLTGICSLAIEVLVSRMFIRSTTSNWSRDDSSIEAAVVFGDKEAATDSLATIVEQ